MRSSVFAAAFISLAPFAEAQTGGTTGSYCDEIGRCFASYTLDNGITYGVAIPEAQEAPFRTIIQITAPVAIGWAGFSWGNTMTYRPLTVTWPDDDNIVVSPRTAVSYSQPTTEDSISLRLLDGSFVNDTHWVATAVCNGCSTWDFGAEPGSIDPNAENVASFAYSPNPVNNPGNSDSTFSIHEEADNFLLDFASAQSADFDDWAGSDDNPTDPDPTPTPTPTPTGSPPTDPPLPDEPVPVPTGGCGLESFLPLEAAEGWSFVKLAGDLTTPRGVVVDSKGSLLVVEVKSGLSVHTFGGDGCIAGSKLLIDKPALTHGVALSPDGTTLYVSSISTVWKYNYDPVKREASNEQVVVQNMYPSSHTTRTLLNPPDTPELLIVSLGSDGNLDMPALDKNTGRAIVKVFNMTNSPSDGYDYSSEGWFLGYGLRNEVGLVTDPSNMIWGVENSADDFARVVDGVEHDIHQDNPADEVNYLGDPLISNDNWYGYPTCFTVWGGDEFPDGTPVTGSQFIPAPNDTWTDSTCEERSRGPRLSFQAHSAPIDAAFDKDATNMYVTLHGSWNRDIPTGYKVVEVPFTTTSDGAYEPVAASDSKTGYEDILWDPQQGCDSSKCFRPSGLTFDREFSRIFVASDNSQEGELYVLYKSS